MQKRKLLRASLGRRSRAWRGWPHSSHCDRSSLGEEGWLQLTGPATAPHSTEVQASELATRPATSTVQCREKVNACSLCISSPFPLSRCLEPKPKERHHLLHPGSPCTSQHSQDHPHRPAARAPRHWDSPQVTVGCAKLTIKLTSTPQCSPKSVYEW